MNAIKTLVGWLEEHFQDGHFTLTPPAGNGYVWFLDIRCNEKYLIVAEWIDITGFYVYTVSDDLRVEFERVFKTENDTFKYIVELIGKIKCIN